MAKEYELVGGQPVKVTPLEVTEAGTYKAPHGQAFNPVKVTGGGGGGLPPITPADDGSFPVAQDGTWSKVGGYSVSESTEAIIAEQTVTTVANQGGLYVAGLDGNLGGLSAGDSVKVTYNGIAIVLPVMENDGTLLFGADVLSGDPDWDTIPFAITGNYEEAVIATPTAQTATVKVESAGAEVEVSEDFVKAVNKANAIKIYIPKQTVTQTVEDQNGVTLTLADDVTAATLIQDGEAVTVTINGIRLTGYTDGDLYYWMLETDEYNYYVGMDNDDHNRILLDVYDNATDQPAAGDFTVEGIGIKQSASGGSIPTIWLVYDSHNGWSAEVSDEQALIAAIDNKMPIQAFAVQGGAWQPATVITYTDHFIIGFYGFSGASNTYFAINEMILEIQGGTVTETANRTIQLAYYSGVN